MLILRSALQPSVVLKLSAAFRLNQLSLYTDDEVNKGQAVDTL
jgi:hypothetical protein